MEKAVWLLRLHTASTRSSYGRWLDRFAAFSDCPVEATLTWSVEQAEDAMLAWKHHLLNAGLSGQTVSQAWQAVKRWFRDNRVKVDVKLEGVRMAKTYLDYIPSREDVKRLLEACPLKYKVVVVLIAFAGMRPVDVRNLRYMNVKASLEVGDDVLTLTLQQAKTGEWYVTFLGPQGAGYLRRLLEERRARGEAITDDTYVVSDAGEMLSSNALKGYLRAAITRSVGRHPTGEPFRLFRSYGLRKYFRRTARRLGTDTAEFLMGHVAGLESLSAVYDGLRDMDPRAIQNIKQEYTALLPELETEISDVRFRRFEEEIDELRDENIRLTSRLNHLIEREEEVDDTMESIINDPEVEALLARKLRELGAGGKWESGKR